MAYHVNMVTRSYKVNIIAVSNHKGGVGKTTTTANLGAALAEKNKRCLIIDLDPQANLSKSLGVLSPESTIYDTLINGEKPSPIEVRPNLDLIPSSLKLAKAEMELVGEPGREMVLKDALSPFFKRYDFILIDCPPSLGLLNLNAFVACQRVIIPLQTQFLAVQGLTEIIEVVAKVKQRLNRKISLAGVLLTQYDRRKVLDRQVTESVKKSFKGPVFNTKIRGNVSLAEAPSRGKDIFSYSPHSYGAQDYKAFCREFLRKI